MNQPRFASVCPLVFLLSATWMSLSCRGSGDEHRDAAEDHPTALAEAGSGEVRDGHNPDADLDGDAALEAKPTGPDAGADAIDASRDAFPDVTPAEPEAGAPGARCPVYADLPTVSLSSWDGSAITSVAVLDGPCDASGSRVNFEYWLYDDYKCRRLSKAKCEVEVTTLSGVGRASVVFGLGGIPTTWVGTPKMVTAVPMRDGGTDAR